MENSIEKYIKHFVALDNQKTFFGVKIRRVLISKKSHICEIYVYFQLYVFINNVNSIFKI